jgi:hypothetical protein
MIEPCADTGTARFPRPMTGLLTALLAVTVCGCASYRGEPKSIEVYALTPGEATAAAANGGASAASAPPLLFVKDNCPGDATIADFNAGRGAPAGLTKGQWRDLVIEDCIGRVDSQYAAFTASLHKEAAGTGLGFGITGFALTGAGAVAAKTTANALSAASTALTGIGAEVNKDLFYQKAIPAIVAQMDANRETVLGSIKTSEKSDPTGLAYTLWDAQHDIRNYQAAGSIDRAISTITAAAQQSATDSVRTIKALETVGVVDDDSQAFQVKVDSCVHKISADSRADLDRVASAIGVTVDAAQPFSLEKQKVLLAVSTIVGADKMAAAKAKLQSTKCPGE